MGSWVFPIGLKVRNSSNWLSLFSMILVRRNSQHKESYTVQEIVLFW